MTTHTGTTPLPDTETLNADHPSKNDLPSTMTAREIMSSYRIAERERRHWSEKDADLWDRKLDEAHRFGLTADLMENGVLNPVALRIPNKRRNPKPTILLGYHRIAAMMEINPDAPIPVTHHLNLRSAKKDEEARGE